MPRSSATSVAHPDDGELVRLLDGALPIPERDRTAAHVGSCRACSERLEALRRRSTVLSDTLRRVDGIDWLPTLTRAAPVARSDNVSLPRGHGTRLAYAPASILLVAAVAFVMVSPLGAWVTREVRRMVPGVKPAAVDEPRSEGVLPRSIAVSFTPDTGEVLFWLDAQPAGGALELRRGEGRGAAVPMVEVFGGRPTEEVVVMPNGIRIHTDSLSKAVYRLTVPDRRIRVRIRVGGRGTDTVLDVSDKGSRLDLRPRGGRQ